MTTLTKTLNPLKALAIAAPVLAIVTFSSAVSAQQLDCSQFTQNSDGSWSPVGPVRISGPGGSVQIGPGVRFNPGVAFMGIDLAASLNRQCK